MLRPPRRLYVTHAEFDQLHQLGQGSSIRDSLLLMESEVDDEAAAFAQKVADLLDVSLETLTKYAWHVEVVSVVRRRVGRAWVLRRLAGVGRR